MSSIFETLLGIIAGEGSGSTGGGSGLSGTTLNPSDKTTGILLSGGNLSAAMAASNYGFVRATSHLATGKYYYECTFNGVGFTTASSICVGLANIVEDITHTLGSLGFAGSSNSVGAYNSEGMYINNGSAVQWTPTACADGDVIAFAVDLDHGKVWAKNLTNGSNWNNGNAGANPATNSGGVDISALGTPGATDMYPAAGFYFNSGFTVSLTINFGDTTFTGSVPSGFHAWDSPL